jgi:glycosyltransferase involved in cell wall biosynthesis
MNQYRPDLVLTYNWGALDGAMAALVPPRIPTIHTEDGFGIDEATVHKRRRVLTRRFLLPHVSYVVAPSHVLFDIMSGQWQLPERKVLYIANGVDSTLFSPPPATRCGDEVLIGTAAQLRPEKKLDVLIRSVAQLSSRSKVRLDIAGDGPKREELQRLVSELGISSRVRFLGNIENMSEFYRTLDVFAMTSSTEQMPYAVLEATSTGLPVVSTDVGDIKAMVSSENRPFVVQECGLVEAMSGLIENADLRRRVGEANRVHCVEHYDLGVMLSAYESLYLRLSKN